MKSKNFFQENIQLIDPRQNPLDYNLNAGLIALSKEVEELRNTVLTQARQIESLLQRLR